MLANKLVSTDARRRTTARLHSESVAGYLYVEAVQKLLSIAATKVIAA
jgi:hypothetical protein